MADYVPKVYKDQGGDRLVIASGGTINVESGGSFQLAGTALTATAAELNLQDAAAGGVAFAAAAGGANVCEVTITVTDAAGATVASPFNLDVWLSDAATGVGLTGTTASGTVTAKAASGAVVGTYTAKKALRVQTLATGIFILEITDTAKTAFVVAATNPNTGATEVAAALETADYG